MNAATLPWTLFSRTYCYSVNLNLVLPKVMSHTARIAVAFSLSLCLTKTSLGADILVLPGSYQLPTSTNDDASQDRGRFSQASAKQTQILNGLITVASTPIQNSSPPLGTGVLAPPQQTTQQTPPLLRSPVSELPEPKVQTIKPPRALNPATPSNEPATPLIGEPVQNNPAQNKPAQNKPVESIPIESIPVESIPVEDLTDTAPLIAEPVQEIIYATPGSVATSHQSLPRHRRFLRACGNFCKPLRPISLFDSGLVAATESTFLSASTLGKTQVVTTDLLTNANDSQEVEGGFGFGQRIILGLQSNVFGLEVIYWNFADESFDSGVWKNGSHTPQYGLGRRLDIETLDLGITQRFCLSGCRIKTALGLRMLDFGASEQANAMRNYHQNTMEVSSAAMLKRDVDAIGPTLAIAGKHSAWPKGCKCGSTCSSDCFAIHQKYRCKLYWDTRISWLWADQSSSAMTEAVAATATLENPAVARSQDGAITTTDESELQMHFGLQAGLEVCRRIGCRSNCILRCGLEYQYFEIGRDYTASTSTAFLTDGSTFGAQTAALAENSSTDLHMFGISFLAGVNY